MDQKTFKFCIFILPWFRVNNEIFTFDVVILEMNIKYVNYKQYLLLLWLSDYSKNIVQLCARQYYFYPGKVRFMSKNMGKPVYTAFLNLQLLVFVSKKSCFVLLRRRKRCQPMNRFTKGRLNTKAILLSISKKGILRHVARCVLISEK